MGAWFVMAALGLFQMDGGCRVDPIYELGSPLFPRAVIHLDAVVVVVQHRGPGNEDGSAHVEVQPLVTVVLGRDVGAGQVAFNNGLQAVRAVAAGAAVGDAGVAARANLDAIAAALHNDFERVVLRDFPPIAALRERLLAADCRGALLCGSGAAVFGLCYTREQADGIAADLRDEGLWATAAEPSSHD